MAETKLQSSSLLCAADCRPSRPKPLRIIGPYVNVRPTIFGIYEIRTEIDTESVTTCGSGCIIIPQIICGGWPTLVCWYKPSRSCFSNAGVFGFILKPFLRYMPHVRHNAFQLFLFVAAKRQLRQWRQQGISQLMVMYTERATRVQTHLSQEAVLRYQMLLFEGL